MARDAFLLVGARLFNGNEYFGSKILPLANTTAGGCHIIGTDCVNVADACTGIIHVAGFVVVVSVLGALSEKHTASYVFTDFSNTSGWTNDGTSWLVGLLSTVYPFLGYVLPYADEYPN